MLDNIRARFGSLKSALFGKLPENSDVVFGDLINSDNHVRRFGYGVILFLFGGIGLWSVLAPLESAAIGMGIVQVEGNRKAIQHLDGGIVSEILVSNGDFVSVGDPLLKLDDNLILAEKNIVEGRFWGARAKVDRLTAERDGDEAISFANWLQAVDDERAFIATHNEGALFEARRADRRGEMALLRQQITQLSSRIDGAQSVLKAKKSMVVSIDAELADLQALLTDGFVDKQRIRQLERTLAQSLGEVDELKASISSFQVAIVETELKITQLKKRFISGVIDELARTQNELFDQELRLAALVTRLKRTTINAPVSGVVMAISPNGAGEVVGAGEELMAVVPDSNALVVSTRLSVMDRDRLSIGQEAEVRFSVFKDAYSVTGELITLSADSILDDATGSYHYEGKVILLEEDMALLEGNDLVPGMPATVLIKTGTRTLLGYLTSPLQRMFETSLTED